MSFDKATVLRERRAFAAVRFKMADAVKMCAGPLLSRWPEDGGDEDICPSCGAVGVYFFSRKRMVGGVVKPNFRWSLTHNLELAERYQCGQCRTAGDPIDYVVQGLQICLPSVLDRIEEVRA